MLRNNHHEGGNGMDIIFSDNLFRQLSMKHVQGYESLPDSCKELFDTVYKRHLASMDKKTRREHTDEHILKVKRDLTYDCLIVYFKNGNKYKYWKNNSWDPIKR